MNFLNSIGFFSGLSSAIKAVILLAIAFAAAFVAKLVVKLVLNKLVFSGNDAKETDEIEEKKEKLVTIIANTGFAIVFIMFLPGVFDALGVTSVSGPLSAMATKFMEFLPNIIAAVILLVFGVFFARLVKQIIETLLAKTKLDELQKKVGVKGNGIYTFTGIIANLIYAIILVIFVVAALQVLNLKAISSPATEMLEMVFSYLPLAFAALVVILFGVFLAKIVSGLVVSVLAGSGLDGKTEGLYPKKADGTRVTTTSKLIGIIISVIINIFFIVAGISILKIEVLTNIGNAVIGYLPNILAAVIIVIVAWICANKAATAIQNSENGSKTLAIMAKVAIIALAGFMALSQLGIGHKIIEMLFFCIVIALAGAFIIAFGVGGRKWAEKKLEDIDEKIKKK